MGLVDLFEHRSARALRDPGAALASISLHGVAPEGERGARARRAAVVRDIGGSAPRNPHRVGVGPRLAALPWRAVVARRPPRVATRCALRARADSLFRGALRLRK